MKTRIVRNPGTIITLALVLASWPIAGLAQVPVDDSGNPIGDYQPLSQQTTAVTNSETPLATPAELENLVGSVALYPDDLLAIILPAATYPLQLVEASRFLDDLNSDPSLKPDDDWDDSVVALTNYPEVIELLNADLDWTWRLGEAVVAQQPDVIAAIEAFRDRAYAAGNLKSDQYQNVTQNDGVIEISPVSDDVIYVPYYEPERVVVYQPRPVYNYYPRAYPVYYYPYPYGYSFNSGYFWGVTTAFTIGWSTDYLHVYHNSYYGHPYYGHNYNNWWYRRPSIHVHNNYYVNNYYGNSGNHYQQGDRWHSNSSHRMSSGQQITRSRHYPNNSRQAASSNSSNSFAPAASRNGVAGRNATSGAQVANTQRQSNRDGLQSNARSTQNARQPSTVVDRNTSRDQQALRTAPSNAKNDIRFRERDNATQNSSAARSTARNFSSQQPSSSRTPTGSSTNRSTPDSAIRFAPRESSSKETKRSRNATRDVPSRSPTTATTQRNTVIARNETNARKSVNTQRSTVSSQKSAPTRVQNTARAPSYSAPRQSAPRQSTQRQSAPAPQKARSSKRNSESKSASSPSKQSSNGNSRTSRRN